MPRLSQPERTVTVWYYLLTLVATLIWHVALQVWPELRPLFVGKIQGVDLYSAFIIPDLLACLVLAGVIAWLVHQEMALSQSLAWLFAGGQGYAFLIACWLAAQDPTSYWGLFAMAFSSGTALMFATRLSNINLLWGPFRFRAADPASPSVYWTKALGQTCVMWFIFLAAIPWAISAVEVHYGWHENWIHIPYAPLIGTLLFVGASSFGLLAGWVMTHTGGGTPLPHEGANSLVRTGPYRYVRNPMALGGIIQGIAVGLFIGSPLVVLYAVLGGVAWNTLIRPLEEEHLEGGFGEEYRAYRSRIRCWWPTFRTDK